MIEQIQLIFDFIASEKMLLTCSIIGIFIKTYLLGISSKYALKSKQFNFSFVIFLTIIIGTIFEDLAWTFKLFRTLGYINNYNLVIFTIRLAWFFCIIHYQALINFSNLLIPFNYKNKIYQKICSIFNCVIVGLSFAFAGFYLYLAVFQYDLIIQPRYIINFYPLNFFGINNEIKLIHLGYHYSLALSLANFALLVFKLFFAKKNLVNIPTLVRRQVYIFLFGIIGPKLLSEFFQAYQFSAQNIATIIQPIYSISCLISILMFYFCIKRILGSRLLNLTPEVNKSSKSKFMIELKSVSEQLSQVQDTNEIQHIVNRLFEKSVGIAPDDSVLYLRSLTNELNKQKISLDIKNIELLLMLSEQKIIYYEEIEFNNFYNQDSNNDAILELMTSINTAIFIPIKHQESILGAICIKPSGKRLFSKIEHDEIQIFSRYLSHTIYTVQQASLQQLLNKCKKLEEELFNKHREINQYKESLRYLFKNNTDNQIGVLYYKNRKFIFANEAAKKIIDFNINQLEGHPLTKELKSVAFLTEQYKNCQTRYYTDLKTQKKYVVSALPNLEQNNIIITISYAEATDIIKEQINNLRNPSDWDYLLYLETTKSGIFVNNLIPGNSETLINLKIDLLKIALTKKAILVSSSQEDTELVVNLLHKISLKEQIEYFTIAKNADYLNLKTNLFGSCQITNEKDGLLTKHCTLVIKNVENLPLKIQDELAETIKYGTFCPYKSNMTKQTETRLIFTTNLNIESLHELGKISFKLYEQIQNTNIEFPSLEKLTNQELLELTRNIAIKTLQHHDAADYFELNNRDQEKLINQRPNSLTQLTNNIKNFIQKKNVLIDGDTETVYELKDPVLIQAAKLGKNALKNEELMKKLWDTFKNQNQIADFLKVNRSSVLRRCREYNLH
jgi:DNA-binding NtrC family response regulator